MGVFDNINVPYIAKVMVEMDGESVTEIHSPPQEGRAQLTAFNFAHTWFEEYIDDPEFEGLFQVLVKRNGPATVLALAGDILKSDGIGDIAFGVGDHLPGQGGYFLGPETRFHR